MPRYRIDEPTDGVFKLGRFTIAAEGLADLPVVDIKGAVNLQDVSVEFPVRMRDTVIGHDKTVIFAFTGKLSRAAANVEEERKLEEYKASSKATKAKEKLDAQTEREKAIADAEALGRVRGADFAAAKLAQDALRAQVENTPKPPTAGEMMREAAELLKASRTLQAAIEE